MGHSYVLSNVVAKDDVNLKSVAADIGKYPLLLSEVQL